jgi:hypothetical protein
MHQDRFGLIITMVAEGNPDCPAWVFLNQIIVASLPGLTSGQFKTDCLATGQGSNINLPDMTNHVQPLAPVTDKKHILISLAAPQSMVDVQHSQFK